MLSRIRSSLYNHRHILIGSTAVIGGAIYAMKYAQKRLLDWQDLQLRESLEKAAKEQHFRNTERTFRLTVSSLGETLKNSIDQLIKADKKLEQIKNSTGKKVELWNELKILVFTHVCSLLYSGLMLVILLKIQLNILSGIMFKNENLSIQENYLNFCQHFMTTGVKELVSVIQKHVTVVVQDISLKKNMTLKDIEQIFWSIETSLSNDPLDPIRNSSEYLLPKVDNLDAELKSLCEETADILLSEDVISLFYSSVRRLFSNTVDLIASSFYTENVEITKAQLAMAKVIPVVHGLYKDKNADPDAIDPWIAQILIMDKINMLGANIYDAFSSKE